MTRLTQESPTRLLVHSRPGAWLQAALWLAFGAYLYWVMPTYRLELARVSDHQADITVARQLFGLPLSESRIAGVRSAALQIPYNITVQPGRDLGNERKWLDPTSRIVFETERGPVPMTSSYSVGLGTHQTILQELKQFLANNEPSRTRLDLARSAWFWPGFILLGFAAFGSSFVARRTCLIDRDRDQVIATGARRTRSQRREYRLSEIDRFMVIQISGRDAERRGWEGTQYSLGARMRNGEEISITQEYSSWCPDSLLELADQLERFRKDATPEESREV